MKPAHCPARSSEDIVARCVLCCSAAVHRRPLCAGGGDKRSVNTAALQYAAECKVSSHAHRSKLTYYRSVVEIGHLSDLSLLLISIPIAVTSQSRFTLSCR